MLSRSNQFHAKGRKIRPSGSFYLEAADLNLLREALKKYPEIVGNRIRPNHKLLGPLMQHEPFPRGAVGLNLAGRTRGKSAACPSFRLSI